MLKFGYNIVIDGDTIAEGKKNDRGVTSEWTITDKDFQCRVAKQASQLASTQVGWIVLSAIERSGKTVTIKPSFDHDNATTQPDDDLAAAPKGIGVPAVCGWSRGGTVPAKGVGTHEGTTSVIRYDPLDWKGGSPGNSPDEMLLHELVHAMRNAWGVYVCLQSPDLINDGYSHQEEFFAIMITNIYASGLNRLTLRADWSGFESLKDPGQFHKKLLVETMVQKLWKEQYDVVWRLAALNYRFNPIRAITGPNGISPSCRR